MKRGCNLTLNEELIKEIDIIAKNSNRSRSYIINQIIEENLKKYKKGVKLK